MTSIRRILIFFTFLALSKSALGQEAQDPEIAKQYLLQAELMLQETQALDDARELLVRAAEADTTFIKANYEAGNVLLLTIDKHLAVKYLLRVHRQDPNYRYALEYWIGKSYQYGLEFDRAIEYFNRYKQTLSRRASYQGKDKVDADAVARAIDECTYGKQLVAKPGNFSIVNIGREINSEFDDFGPVLNEAEDEIFFTTRRRDDNTNENVAEDNLPWEDIFWARKKSGNWDFAKNVGTPVNTPYHDSNLAVSADGRMLFTYHDEGNGDIYFAEFVGVEWKEPQPLAGVVNSTYQEKSVSVSKDGKTLYFSSDRPGGLGGLDIYKATMDRKGQWTNVKNLGPSINTEFDDDGPFIDYDGVTLFFSSKGHRGMGGYDVFKSSYDSKKNDWSTPINLGYPINTPDNDIYFVASKDSKRAYYSSVREDGMGYLDIYLITVPDGLKNDLPVVAEAPPVEKPKEEVKETPPPVEVVKNDPVPVKEEPKEEPKKEPKQEPKVEPKKELKPVKYIVKVVDASDKSPLSSKVRMVGAKDNVVVGSSSIGDGMYEFSITSKAAKDYRLSIERGGYVFQNLTFSLDGASDEEKVINRTIEMRKLDVGVTSILRNIYFDFGKATFKTDSYAELNKLESMLRQNEGVKVEIGGHTDGVGSKAFNDFLSKKRAEAVKDYLTKKGIDPRRIKAVGYGKSKPLASNDDETEGRSLNRRVEFKVLSN